MSHLIYIPQFQFVQRDVLFDNIFTSEGFQICRRIFQSV